MINIHVVIDTELVLQDAPDSGQDRDSRSVRHGHAHMVVRGAASENSQGAEEVAFDASPGTAVRFFLKSGSNNFEHVVLLRDIQHVQGDEVLDRFEPVTEDRIGIAPASATSVLPAQSLPHRFSFHRCEIAHAGTGTYRLTLDLWDRDASGQPRFAGHYRWDPRITVRFV
ncbi:MAG TPA: AidA/PixA family protein [Kofleriaceae bacterium]|jgi:hypothetical protein|nr:AidA/PixA family protein [Kofleriaceae bacterium]